MSTQPDGGPAFPTKKTKQVGILNVEVVSPGMSLRDWFAGKALSGMLSQSPSHIGSHHRSHFNASIEHVKRTKGDSLTLDDVFDDQAETAYRIADAMLKARAK